MEAGSKHERYGPNSRARKIILTEHSANPKLEVSWLIRSRASMFKFSEAPMFSVNAAGKCSNSTPVDQPISLHILLCFHPSSSRVQASQGV